ncbi:MAG TPA: metalloregulator ArsR/SmtB family transcription factor [bacterium]|nr:metalloregulator ArsR/SmtB family transcription factor [bacterium]
MKNSNDRRYLDQDRVARVRGAMVGDAIVQGLAETFKAIGDPTRTKMLYVLGREELCVGDLAALLGMSPSAISHQLRVLRHLRLVRNRRHGRVTYYALDDMHIRNLMTEGLRHVIGQETS